MIAYLPAEGDVIACRIVERLSEAELEQLAHRVERSLEHKAQTHLFVEIVGLKSVAIDGDYLGRAWNMLRRRDRFGRIAVVSDQAWVRWATRIESALIPNLSYEVFLPEERERALAWVKGEHLQPHDPAIRIIETSKPNVIGFELNGKLTVEEIEATAAYFAAARETDQPLRILGRIKHIGGVEFAGLFNRDYAAMKLGVLARLDRYALVGAPDWVRAWAKALNPLLKAELLCFDEDEEALAWSWLGATPVSERALVA